MTIQALLMLHRLKKIQGTETESICIDTDRKTATKLKNGYPDGLEVSLEKVWSYAIPSIHYLFDQKLLERERAYTIRLTHSGYHYWQTIFSMIMLFLFRSILVPIFVALITTLVTLWIQGTFLS